VILPGLGQYMTLTLFNDYPTTRSRYSPSNSPAAESLSQGSFIGARKPYQITSFGRKGRFGAQGPAPVPPIRAANRPVLSGMVTTRFRTSGFFPFQ
jgi:hypothetical protein